MAFRTPGSSTAAKILGAIITLGFFMILVGMMAGWLKTSGNSEALLLLLGALSAAFGAVVNFYFGSSKGSEDKTEVLLESMKNRPHHPGELRRELPPEERKP